MFLLIPKTFVINNIRILKQASNILETKRFYNEKNKYIQLLSHFNE